MPEPSDRSGHEAAIAGPLAGLFDRTRGTIEHGGQPNWAAFQGEARQIIEDEILVVFFLAFIALASDVQTSRAGGEAILQGFAQTHGSNYATRQANTVAAGLTRNIVGELANGREPEMAFSPKRAEVLAATEITRANSVGEFSGRDAKTTINVTIGVGSDDQGLEGKGTDFEIDDIKVPTAPGEPTPQVTPPTDVSRPEAQDEEEVQDATTPVDQSTPADPAPAAETPETQPAEPTTPGQPPATSKPATGKPAPISAATPEPRKVAVWNTERDAKVCPICSPLDKKREPDWVAKFPTGPPAHPNCRCHLTFEDE